jgi:hypothetical protein
VKNRLCLLVETLAPFVVSIRPPTKTVPALVQVRDIGSGNFGVAKLMKDKQTGQLVAVKFIERGDKVSTLWFSFFLLSFGLSLTFQPSSFCLLAIFCCGAFFAGMHLIPLAV